MTDNKDVVNTNPDGDLPMSAKLLLEMRTHRAESKAQFQSMAMKMESLEKRQLEVEGKLDGLTEQVQWGRGAVRGIFWLGGALLAIWGVFTGWVKIFPPGG